MGKECRYWQTVVLGRSKGSHQWFILLNNPLGFSKSGKGDFQSHRHVNLHINILRLENKLITMAPPNMQYCGTCWLLNAGVVVEGSLELFRKIDLFWCYQASPGGLQRWAAILAE